jgi:glycosyltransferase involved in cell wall biosynthesis
MNKADNTPSGNSEGKPITVCFPFIGDRLGGSHVSALGLIKGLDRSQFAPLVVLHDTEGPVAALFRREGVEFEAAPIKNSLEQARLRNLGALVKIIGALPVLTAYLKARKVAIVHTNDGRIHVPWGAAARLSGAKLLWHHRGVPEAIGLNLIAPWLANRVVSVSKFTAPKPGIFTAARKSSVIFSPFDVNKALQFDREKSREMILKEIGETQDVHLIGYVGNLIARKRPIVFVETIAALKAIAPDMRCLGLFIGSAPDELDQAAKHRAQQLGVDDRVHFLGYRYPGEAWIAGLNALFVPSVDEPLGRTLVEAMLLGTPVIASDSGGNREAITDGQTGKIVRPEDPQAFAHAYLGLISRPRDLARIVENAQMEARERFSTERHVRAVEAIYHALVH